MILWYFLQDDNNPGRSAKKEEKSQAEGKEPEKNGGKEDSKKGKEASVSIHAVYLVII